MQDSLSDLVHKVGKQINKSKSEDCVNDCKEYKVKHKEKCKKVYCK